MFITSKGTMDKASPEVRKYIARRAVLLGAIRLPDNTFKANAGTEVTSDILILQKRDRVMDIEPDWVHLDTDENGVTMNRYFVEHPEMVLGEIKMESTRFGTFEPVCKARKDIPLSEFLSNAVQRINGESQSLIMGLMKSLMSRSFPFLLTRMCVTSLLLWWMAGFTSERMTVCNLLLCR